MLGPGEPGQLLLGEPTASPMVLPDEAEVRLRRSDGWFDPCVLLVR